MTREHYNEAIKERMIKAGYPEQNWQKAYIAIHKLSQCCNVPIENILDDIAKVNNFTKKFV